VVRSIPAHNGAASRVDPEERVVSSERSGAGPRTAAAAAVEREVVVGDRGRVVLPAAVRAELGLREGSRLLLSTEPDGSLRLRPYRAVTDSDRGLLAGLGSGSMVDELIAERRAEVAAQAAR
jgi:AbrB family looped-hinge helix DNA binding protein